MARVVEAASSPAPTGLFSEGLQDRNRVQLSAAVLVLVLVLSAAVLVLVLSAAVLVIVLSAAVLVIGAASDSATGYD